MDPAPVARMLATLHHRGPDDQGLYASGSAAFGFRRLSILDLSPAGHQPMSTPDGQVTIVFNGEIYNFLELRRDLELRGYVFRSRSDTEVLLHAYLEWGTGCVERLVGMWAFLIHDQRVGSLFGSRDRFGMKPLYLHRADGQILFASEIKAILASGLCRRTPHLPVVATFLTEGRLDETDETFFSGIVRFPAASAFEIDAAGNYREWRYWSSDAVAVLEPGTDLPGRFAGLFEDSVRLHMRSDVPVGIHLSGGLDSTSIACAVAKFRAADRAREPLHVFSYIAPEFDESSYIRATLKFTGAQLTELQTDPARLWGDLERLLWYQDEPVHSMTALVSFQLMRATALHGVRVILNGQGADETLAGYPSFFRNRWEDVRHAAGVVEAVREIASYARVHGGTVTSLFMELLVRKALRTLGQWRVYRGAVAIRRRARMKNGWYAPELLNELPRQSPVAPASLDGALAFSQAVTPLPLYLRLEDRNAMAHSIEGRLPFLDHRLVEFVRALPGEWKMSGPWNKHLLRESMRRKIPEEVRARVDKMGFPVPARQWFRERLFEPVMDLLGSASRSAMVRREVVERDIGRFCAGEIDITDRLFELAQFELWQRGVSSPGPVPQGDIGEAVLTRSSAA